jgi:hypothetical protein
MSGPAFIKPPCGTQAPPVDDALTTILTFWGFVSGVGGGVVGLLKLGQEAFDEGVLFGLAGADPFVITAIFGVLLITGIIVVFAFLRCNKRDGLNACAAGVVNFIRESFSSVLEWIFPFTAMHDEVDVTVKRHYWELVRHGAGFIKCAGDSDESPVLQCFYYSKEVCNAISGSLIGAIVAGIGAIALAILLSPLIAVGCALGPIICALVLVLVFLAAALITLIGATIGGLIAKASGEESQPTAEGQAVQVGHYITVMGTLVRHAEFDDAVVMWFVENSMLHGGPSDQGQGQGGGPPYPERDPFQNLPIDGCAPVLPT